MLQGAHFVGNKVQFSSASSRYSFGFWKRKKGKPQENPGKTPEKPQKNPGKTPGTSQKNLWKTLGKPRENPRKNP